MAAFSKNNNKYSGKTFEYGILVVKGKKINYEKLLLCLKNNNCKPDSFNITMLPLHRLEVLLKQIVINKIVIKNIKPTKKEDPEKEKLVKKLDSFTKEAVNIIENLLDKGVFNLEEDKNSLYKISA